MNVEHLFEEIESLLALGFPVPDVLEACGRSYEPTRRLARRHGRSDLVEALSEWKNADAERLAQARGVSAF